MSPDWRRLPHALPATSSFSDPCKILNSRIFHSTILSIFFRAVHTRDVSEHLLALAVFLLEIAVETSDDVGSGTGDRAPPALAAVVESSSGPGYHGYGTGRHEPPKLFHCYPTDNLSCNLRHVVKKVSLKSRDPQVITSSYRSNPFYSDLDFEVEADPEQSMRMIGQGDPEGDEATGGAGLGMGAHSRRNVSQALVPMRVPGMEVALPPDLSVVAETGVVIRQDSNEDDLLREGNHAMDMSPPAALDFHFPLQQITLPESGMEVAIRRDLLLAETNNMGAIAGGAGGGANASATPPAGASNEMFSPTTPTGSGMLLPFQRVQPVAVPSSGNMDIVPSNAMGAGGSFTSGVSGSGTGRRMNYETGGARKRSVDIAIGGSNKDELHLDESILSLLLKLHSQLSGTLDSFSLSDGEDQSSDDDSTMDVDCNEASTSMAAAESTALAERGRSKRNYKNIHVSSSRIGDGPFFIGNLLRKIAKQDEQCAQSIDDIRARLWPNQREKQAEAKAREAKEKEERRKKARERQQKMMQDFANKQKLFMQSAAASSSGMGYGPEDEDDEELYEEQPREKEYDCIICNCTTPSTESNPIGLVVLVESSGIVGHRRRIAERLPLPLNAEDESRLAQIASCSARNELLQ